MKTLCVLLASVAILSSATAQFRFAVKAGVAPARVMGTAPVIVNRNDYTSDFLFNGNKVEISPALGVALRFKTKDFFFEGEAMYSSIRKSYAMQYIEDKVNDELKYEMEESCKSIYLPLSAGVTLGLVEITSGFSMRYEFDQASTLSQMHHFSREIDNTVFGWHSGIGINLGRVSAELRYQQDFANYGQGIFVNDQELLLRNAPSQLRFMVGLWF